MQMMKTKVFLVILLSFSMLIPFSYSIKAGSGCCSGHGGVDCDAGEDVDGSVICEDGWTESSCSYQDMAKCTITPYTEPNSTHNTYNNKNNNNNSQPIITQNKSNDTGLLIGLISLPFILSAVANRKEKTIPKNDPQSRSRQSSSNNNQKYYTCPRCGGRLIIKNGKYGPFYGCENYRTKGCKYTRNI